MKKSQYIVSPYKQVKIGGRKRGWISFKTKKQAVSFIKRRKLKRAILYRKVPRR